MTPIAKLLHSQLMVLRPFISSCSLSSVRKGQDKLGKLMAKNMRSDVSYEEISIGQLRASIIKPKDEVSSAIILYLHGGGYVAGNLDYAKGFATILAGKCSVRVLALEYRLAPENIFPAALEDALDAYSYLIANGYLPSQILICGESAGGGLAYSLCYRLREKERPLPAGIIAISPWTDLTMSTESYTSNASADPSMTKNRLEYFANCYVYGAREDNKNFYPITNENTEDDINRKSDPLISPLFGDVSFLPPSLIFAGESEIMLDDSRKMHEKLLENGRKSILSTAKGMWHGYVLYGLKENEGDFKQISNFIKANVSHQKKLRWMTLDNAAKIFPASRSRSWSNVFRLSATMSEEVDKELLALALDVTVRRFPSIAVRVRPGMFWYYLEEIPEAPEIMEEKPYPLSRMPFDDIRKCAFRVILYNKRISVEFFHALTDGNGGLVFLKTLVSEYIYQKYRVKVPKVNGVLDRLSEPSEEELEDSFQKYAGPYAASRSATDAYKVTGERAEDGFKTNTFFILDADEVKLRAKEKNITVTAYMTAVLMAAVQKFQQKNVRRTKKKKYIKILIPVNLRKIFPSKTLRNFVLYSTPSIDPRLGEYSFDEMCRVIHNTMGVEITEKNMAAMIATNVNDEKPMILKITPLFLKNIVMKLIFNAVGERKSSFSFSNLGLVNMPEEFSRYVERLDFVLSVQSQSPYNTSLITYKGKMNLSIIRNIKEPLLEREISEVLNELGISFTAESNTRESVQDRKNKNKKRKAR